MTSPSQYFFENDVAVRAEPTEAEKHAAALYVCSRAEDAADATTLLQMLGIIDSPPPKKRRDANGRWA